MPPKHNERFYAWILTIYPTCDFITEIANAQPGEEEAIEIIEEDFKNLVQECQAQKAVGQYEKCPKTKRVHLQLALRYDDAITFSTAVARCRAGCNKEFWEPPHRGPGKSRIQIKRYRAKEGSRVLGPMGYPDQSEIDAKQGRRTDLNGAAQIVIDEGITGLVQRDPGMFVKYHRGWGALVQRLRRIEVTAWRTMDVHLLWGDPGVGKTKRAYEQEPGLYRLCLGGGSGNAEWWDGYEGERTILIDDFYGQVPLTRILNLLDGYPMQLPIKGGFTHALFTKVFITSNSPWEEWYETVFEKKIRLKEALKRRINKTTHCQNLTGSWEEEVVPVAELW